jgi:hypothetical protein
MLNSPQSPSWVTEGFVIPREVIKERLTLLRQENRDDTVSARNVVRRQDVPLNEGDFALVQRIASDARHRALQSLVIISPELEFVLVSRESVEQQVGRQRKAYLLPEAPPCTIFVPENPEEN